jgi:hypothetical protein
MWQRQTKLVMWMISSSDPLNKHSSKPGANLRSPLSEGMGKKLEPEQLMGHRKTHDFCGPCCLCVVLDEDIRHAEAVFVANPEGYMVCCAKNRCRYHGKAVSSTYLLS